MLDCRDGCNLWGWQQVGQKRKEEKEREGREEKIRRGSEVSSPFSLVLSNSCSILREVVQSHNRQSLFAQGLLLLRSCLPPSPGEAGERFVGRRWMP